MDFYRPLNFWNLYPPAGHPKLWNYPLDSPKNRPYAHVYEERCVKVLLQSTQAGRPPTRTLRTQGLLCYFRAAYFCCILVM
jgi:hypothetical protein